MEKKGHLESPKLCSDERSFEFASLATGTVAHSSLSYSSAMPITADVPLHNRTLFLSQRELENCRQNSMRSKRAPSLFDI
jgi:hypothetical protein